MLLPLPQKEAHPYSPQGLTVFSRGYNMSLYPWKQESEQVFRLTGLQTSWTFKRKNKRKRERERGEGKKSKAVAQCGKELKKE